MQIGRGERGGVRLLGETECLSWTLATVAGENNG